LTHASRTVRRRLAGGIIVTIIRLAGGPVGPALQRCLLAADLYILAGQTVGPPGSAGDGTGRSQPTGWGCYVGISAALRTRARAGQSLRYWSTELGRLEPEVIVLVRAARPLSEPVRLLGEAYVAQQISSAGWTVLNIRMGSPVAHDRARRPGRLYAEQVGRRIAGLVIGQVCHPHPRQGTGGPMRERLLRLVLAAPPVGRDVDDVLALAAASGLQIHARQPRQRTRRDITGSREGGIGAPRLRTTWCTGRAVVYPPTITRRQAEQTYRQAHPGLPHRRNPARTARGAGRPQQA
jgi:hypothetical protein